MTLHLQNLTIPARVGPLEAILELPRATNSHQPPAFAVICHPHPQFEGTMNNKVVHRTAMTLSDLGYQTIRFNFRGVGQSAGAYGGGSGEIDDAEDVFRFMNERCPGQPFILAGFSFGSYIATQLAKRLTNEALRGLLLISPPVKREHFSFQLLNSLNLPKAIIQGTQDDVCPHSDLLPQFDKWCEPKALFLTDKANHYYDKMMLVLTEQVKRAEAFLHHP